MDSLLEESIDEKSLVIRLYIVNLLRSDWQSIYVETFNGFGGADLAVSWAEWERRVPRNRADHVVNR